MLNLLAQADISNKALTSAIGNLPGAEFISQLLSSLIVLGLIIGGIIFVFMLIVGSVQWITSGGDKGKNELARARISSALIGIVILFALFAIVNLLACFFETNFLRFTIGELSVTGSGSPFCP